MSGLPYKKRFPAVRTSKNRPLLSETIQDSCINLASRYAKFVKAVIVCLRVIPQKMQFLCFLGNIPKLNRMPYKPHINLYNRFRVWHRGEQRPCQHDKLFGPLSLQDKEKGPLINLQVLEGSDPTPI